MIIFSYFFILVFLMALSVALPRGKFLPLKSNGVHMSPFERNSLLEPKILMVLFLIGLFAGLRNENIGIDYVGYNNFYNEIVSSDTFDPYASGLEIGWTSLNLIFAYLGFPPGLFFGLLAFLVWSIFVKSSDDFNYLIPLMFFFVFCNGFFLWSLSGLRQTIAIMLFFYSTQYIRNNKFITYALIIFLASLFHTSVIVMLPFFFLRYLKYNRVIALSTFTLSLAFIGENFTALFIGDIYNYFITNNILFYQLHLSDTERFITLETTGTNLGLLLRTVFTFFILFYGKRIIQLKPEFNIYYLLFTIFAIMSNLFFSIELISRLFLYFYSAFFVVAATTIYFSKGFLQRILSFFFLIGFVSLYFVTVYKSLSLAL